MAWQSSKDRDNAIENATQAAARQLELKLGRDLQPTEMYALNDAITEYLLSRSL